MKRYILTLIILVLAALGSALQAQRPTGDTLTSLPDDYLCPPSLDWFSVDSSDWCFAATARYILGIESYQLRDANHIFGRDFHTDHMVMVAGVAMCAFMAHSPNTIDTVVAHRITDSVFLYTYQKPIRTDTFFVPLKLAAAPWRMENPHRYIHVPPRCGGWFVPDTIEWNGRIAPLYEVMFDNPVAVGPDFIVASSAYNNTTKNSFWNPQWEHYPTRFCSVFSPRCRATDTVFDSSCTYEFWGETFPYPHWIGHPISWLNNPTFCRSHGLVAPDWEVPDHETYYTLSPIFFPILFRDWDTAYCHGVSNLRLAGRSGNNATLMWDSDESGPWEVAYGKASAPRDSFSVVNTSVPTVRLSGFDARTPYHAYVRGYCDLNDSYSDWIGPLEFQVYEGPAQPGDTTAIDQPGSMASFIQLLPNPATSQVQILSSYKMDRIVLFDLGGRTLLDQPADGISSLLDLSALPKGSYIVAIHSAKSIATKKLIVE